MACYRCRGKMVKVTIINTRGREHNAIVCTECGRIYSKEWIFKEVRCRN